MSDYYSSWDAFEPWTDADGTVRYALVRWCLGPIGNRFCAGLVFTCHRQVTK